MSEEVRGGRQSRARNLQTAALWLVGEGPSTTCEVPVHGLQVDAMEDIDRARELRRHCTWAERRLWRLLRSRRLAGYKFRRQYPEAPYFLDFYCIEARLAVELDGLGHGHPDRQRYDAKRDAALASLGIEVKRVWNHQLVKSEERRDLIENLWRILQERVPHPDNQALPPSRREPDRSA
mgnify:CR=1 FL=1